MKNYIVGTLAVLITFAGSANASSLSRLIKTTCEIKSGLHLQSRKKCIANARDNIFTYKEALSQVKFSVAAARYHKDKRAVALRGLTEIKKSLLNQLSDTLVFVSFDESKDLLTHLETAKTAADRYDYPLLFSVVNQAIAKLNTLHAEIL